MPEVTNFWQKITTHTLPRPPRIPKATFWDPLYMCAIGIRSKTPNIWLLVEGIEPFIQKIQNMVIIHL